MCNDYRLMVDLDAIVQDFEGIKIRLFYPEGIPNTAPREDVRMTETAPIVRMGTLRSTAELVMRRWSWPGPTGKPVYNFRSEDRTFKANRVDPDRRLLRVHRPGPEGAAEAQMALHDEGPHRFHDRGDHPLRPGPWRMLHHAHHGARPGVAPYHKRQIVVLGRDNRGRWLDPSVPAANLLRSPPGGSLEVVQVR